MKRNSLVGIVLTLILCIGMIAGPVSSFAAITKTVDNSVDKSTTQVYSQFMITYSCTENDFLMTIYDSDKVKVDYSNPRNEYIETLIEESKRRAENMANETYETSPVKDQMILKEAVTNKFESSYDNREYTWVNDDGSEGGIIIGDDNPGDAGNTNRHMVVTGDYARTTHFVTFVEIHINGHVWDEGVVTKEPTETEDGIRTYTCSACKETKTEVIPKLGSEGGDGTGVQPPEGDDPTDDTPEVTPTDKADNASKAVNTGDDNMLFLTVAVLIAACVALAAMLKMKKNK